MAEPGDGKTLDPVEASAVALPSAADAKPLSPIFVEPPHYLADALADAERLLGYAAESGIKVDDATRDHVLQARLTSSTGWSEECAANLIAALTTLAALVKPVTAASLRACSDGTIQTVQTYLKVAICLAIFIVPFSVASFLVSAISNTIRADISVANDLAVKLQAQLGYPQPGIRVEASPSWPCAPFPPAQPATPPANVNYNDVITELQLYASTIRSIDARARQLKLLVPNQDPDPCYRIRKDPVKLHQVFQLPVGLPNLGQAAQDRTMLYQDIRYFAQNLLDDESFFYGAITTCILPVLYALLGTCAYLLRNFEQQMASRTFIPSDANSARFLIAAIGGAVVGLFNNFTITQGASIPPLALAFLVGYAVDVFFAFLEGLLQMFTRNTAASLPVAKTNTSQ
ncbi:MAG: hypothetical protein WA419_16050, partial [Silvibacterium sp.]